MFLEKITSNGLAHWSYIIGDGSSAAVIDPRRDYQVYIDIAYREGATIDYIFETHRNEDYVIGSLDLSELTGAAIYHGSELPFSYGNPVEDGDEFRLGSAVLTVLETPGHTYESISLALSDSSYGDDTVAVFTGDALFIGDVGRTDFFPDRLEETAGLLYDSINEKILPLGDHVILFPAHGSGSVCGAGMADRSFSTLGYERRHNQMLQFGNRDEFINVKIKEKHNQPAYFRMMEEYNLKGAPPGDPARFPKPFGAEKFEDAMKQDLIAIDIRSPEAFAGAYIPGSLALPLDMVPAYAGWFLPYDKRIGIVTDSYYDVEIAKGYLYRLGYDKVDAFFEEGLHEWEITGKFYETIPAIYAGEVQRRIAEQEEYTLLDVRSDEEYRDGHLPGSYHIPLFELSDRIDEVPEARPVTTFCGSGRRAIIAASLLKRNGFKEVEDCLGSIEACAHGVCEIVKET
jgi:hydroxyacylglutathione hydrolase